MSDPNNGIAYIRVSSEEQVKGTSLEFQDDLCKKFLEAKGFVAERIFRDEGESAKDLSLNNRKGFIAALEYCRTHKVKAFVVLRVDRFARSTEDHFAVRRLLRSYGTTLYSVTEPIGDKPAEKFIETVLSGVAEYDNALRKERCTDGMASRLKQGILPWHPPVGYLPLGAGKRGEKKDQPDPIDPKSFPLIQRGLKEYAAGRITTQADLVRALASWGYERIVGIRPTPQLADRLTGKYLTFYAGIIVNPWTSEVSRGLHRPVITEEEMHLIRDRRAGRARPIKRDRFNPLFPLRRVVRCADCGRHVSGGRSRSRSGQYHAYYSCCHRSCASYGKSIRKADLELRFQKYLAKVQPDKPYWRLLSATIADVLREHDGTISQVQHAHEKKESELTARRRRIFEMREEGAYSQGDFSERLSVVDRELAVHRATSLPKRLASLTEEEAGEALAVLAKNLDAASRRIVPVLTPRFQHFVFPEGIAHDRIEGLRTAKIPRILAVYEGHACPTSAMVHLMRINMNQILAELTELVKLTKEPEEKVHAA